MVSAARFFRSFRAKPLFFTTQGSATLHPGLSSHAPSALKTPVYALKWTRMGLIS